MTKENYNYPNIADKLIDCLVRDYPNILPENKLDDFELGRLIGQQDIIKRLKSEKKYNEEERFLDEE